MKYELLMSSEKIYSFNILQNHSNFDARVNKSKFIILLLPVLMVSTSLAFNIGTVNAQLNLDNFMNQMQEDVQSTIESSNNNNNNNNCNNNISVQSQTNENGKTTSTTRNTCDDATTTTTSTNNINSGSAQANLNGTIVGSEYNQDSGVIINSLFGNWSLTTKDNGSKDFNASFIKQPVNYNLSGPISSGNDTTMTTNNSDNFNAQLTDSNNDIGNTTSYHLSNFVVNSVQQQNEDATYSGKIDVIQEIKSNNATISDETNNFKGGGVSISVIDNRVLFINFDSQTPLSQEFVNIPIVGLVKQ
ncbi:hypothetical protein BH23THE1_BH23THE1_16390 [soil metagenome]